MFCYITLHRAPIHRTALNNFSDNIIIYQSNNASYAVIENTQLSKNLTSGLKKLEECPNFYSSFRPVYPICPLHTVSSIST